jgi:hypothetical protein
VCRIACAHFSQALSNSGSRANVYPWRDMPKDDKDQQQTEQTPKGLTVPVPKRDEFFGNLKKAAKPEKAEDPKKGPPPEPAKS